jgi:hypothetical protein
MSMHSISICRDRVSSAEGRQAESGELKSSFITLGLELIFKREPRIVRSADTFPLNFFWTSSG